MALNCAALAIADFDFFLGRNDHIKNLVFHRHGFDALLKVFAYLILVA